MNRVDFKKKLIIGTANFVNKYGVDSVKINENEIIKILKFLKKNKINKIDTAESYLNKKKFFKKNYKNFQFTTKIIPTPYGTGSLLYPYFFGLSKRS